MPVLCMETTCKAHSGMCVHDKAMSGGGQYFLSREGRDIGGFTGTENDPVVCPVYKVRDQGFINGSVCWSDEGGREELRDR